MGKKLAIIGHPLEGDKVIEILKMLGGRDVGYNGLNSQYYYYIDEYGNIAGTAELPNNRILFVIYTLKEFLEKFSYKIGDKVKVPYKDGRITGNELYEYKILKIKWYYLESTIKYGLPTGNEQRIEYYSTNNLNIWNKKETMDEVNKEFKQKYCRNCGSQRCPGDGEWLEECEYYKNEQRTMEEIKIDIPKGYEFAGVDDNTQQVVFTKIQPEYPKTYEECCKLLDICPKGSIVYAGNWVYGGDYLEKHLEKIKNFQKLLICRNAYWKIYGERMGLGKPWEPDWKDDNDKYFICYLKDEVWASNVRDCNRFLVFPTEEMRDSFLESEEFAQLIGGCKEFL